MSKLSTLKSCCYLCKKESEYFEVHRGCQKSVYFDKLIVHNHYNQTVIKKLIKDSKFYGKKDILEDFAFYLKNKLLENENIFSKENYIITPVSMNFFRKLKR
jgi:predicted amidophosphoribosyltransferase